MEKSIEEVKKGSIEEKKQFFDEYLVLHPTLKNAINKVSEEIQNADEQTLVLVVGPSGIGKSTLIKIIVDNYRFQLKESYSEGIIPIFAVEAIAPDRGSFKWSDYYRRALKELDEPLIEQKINYGELKPRARSNGVAYLSPKYKSADLRQALENAMYYRRVKACLIDEAQHMTIVSGACTLKTQLDTIKSLANVSKTPHILVGTYELLPFLNLSGQLSGRTILVHMPRYSTKSKEEIIIYLSILKQLQIHLPINEIPDLVSNWEFFYLHTLGCVGHLKKLMRRTLNSALDRGQDKLTIKDFERYAMSIKQCETIQREIEEGEYILKEEGGNLERLKKSLGLIEEKTMSKEGRRKRNVGQRNPVRDPVGGTLGGENQVETENITLSN